jgi:hypothetical protein
MPSSYTIDPAKRLVRTRTWGKLTEAETWAHYDKLRHDPAFQPTFRQVCDLREVIELEASTDFLKALAKQTVFARGTRRAYVVTSDLHFGLARMLAAYAEAEGSEIGVFRTMEEAEGWLGEGVGR